MRRPLLPAAAACMVMALAMALASVAAPSTAQATSSLMAKQWGLARIGATQAWSKSTGQGVTIGVVDTGVDLHHADLPAGTKIVATANCIGANGDPSACHVGSGQGQDDEGHGTHVSGIAAAIGGDVGTSGVAPGASLVVAKALDSSGSGSTADIDAGIRWVVSRGAKVVNLSLGDPNFVFTSVLGSSLSDGIEYAWSQGAIPVLAAGNTSALGLGSSNYGSLHAVVVGAVGRDDTVASYSSPTGNAMWALLAPGGSNDGVQEDDVLSTYWVAGKANQYAYLAGTSMATPHVAGALAVLLATGLGPQAAIDRMLGTVNTSVGCGSANNTCHGRLDLARAVTGMGSVARPTASTPASTIAPAARAGLPASTPTTAAPGGAPPPASRRSGSAGPTVAPSSPARGPGFPSDRVTSNPDGGVPAPAAATAAPVGGAASGSGGDAAAPDSSDASGAGAAAHLAGAKAAGHRSGHGVGWLALAAGLLLVAVAGALIRLVPSVMRAPAP